MPIVASAFFGLGFFITLQSLLSYVVDSYGSYAASALTGLIFVRSCAGAFPLFGTQMYVSAVPLACKCNFGADGNMEVQSFRKRVGLVVAWISFPFDDTNPIHNLLQGRDLEVEESMG